MYEFIVLSLLMGGAMHGYGIRQVMNRILGPYRTIAWGPLYGTLRKLQHAGLIEPAPPDEPSPPGIDDQGGGPPSKRYRITAAGHARFLELMQVPREPEPEYEVAFTLKLARFGYVPAELRLSLLHDYAQYSQAHLSHLAESASHVAASDEIPHERKTWILLTLERKRAIWEADAAWIARLIAALEASGPDTYAAMEGDCRAWLAAHKLQGSGEGRAR